MAKRYCNKCGIEIGKGKQYCQPCRRTKRLEGKRRRETKDRKDNPEKYRDKANKYYPSRKHDWKKDRDRKQKNTPQQCGARALLAVAVRYGYIDKPNKCSRCGEIKEKRLMHGHHHKGYDEKYWLDVKWICASCHLRKN